MSYPNSYTVFILEAVVPAHRSMTRKQYWEQLYDDESNCLYQTPLFTDAQAALVLAAKAHGPDNVRIVKIERTVL